MNGLGRDKGVEGTIDKIICLNSIFNLLEIILETILLLSVEKSLEEYSNLMFSLSKWISVIGLAIVDFSKIALEDIYPAERPDSEKNDISSSGGTKCYFYPIYCLSYIFKQN